MNPWIEISPGHQRLFKDRAGHFVLLHKAGIAVAFWLDDDGRVHGVQRVEGIDFRATGNQLKRQGWACIGPGMDYARLLKK